MKLNRIEMHQLITALRGYNISRNGDKAYNRMTGNTNGVLVIEKEQEANEKLINRLMEELEK